MSLPGNSPVAHMNHPDSTRYFLPHQQRQRGEDDSIFFKKEYTKIERNPSKEDRNCERLGLEEAYKELFGVHRIVKAEARVDEAIENYLLTLPFQVLSSLMEYKPDNSEWGPLRELQTLED